MFIDAALMLAHFLSEAAPAARHGRAMAKAGAVEPNSRYSQRALKCTFFRICQLLRQIIAFCGAKWKRGAAKPVFPMQNERFEVAIVGVRLLLFSKKNNFLLKKEQSHPNNRTLRIDVLWCKTNKSHRKVAVR